VTSATSRSSDRRHHLPYYGGLTLWQCYASPAKHLRPQLQHLGVVARERVFYRPHDKVLHSLVVALLDEPVLVRLPRVVRTHVGMQAYVGAGREDHVV